VTIVYLRIVNTINHNPAYAKTGINVENKLLNEAGAGWSFLGGEDMARNDNSHWRKSDSVMICSAVKEKERKGWQFEGAQQ